MQFTNLVVRFGNSGNHAWLATDLIMQYDEKCIRVPKFFKTDFASIPQAVRSLIPQLGKWTSAAVAHDYAYWCGPSLGFTQKSADDMLLKLMEDAGVKWWRRHAIHKGLRIGGWVAWNKHRKAVHTVNNALDQK
jgi:hypothetical protein